MPVDGREFLAVGNVNTGFLVEGRRFVDALVVGWVCFWFCRCTVYRRYPIPETIPPNLPNDKPPPNPPVPLLAPPLVQLVENLAPLHLHLLTPVIAGRVGYAVPFCAGAGDVHHEGVAHGGVAVQAEVVGSYLVAHFLFFFFFF